MKNSILSCVLAAISIGAGYFFPIDNAPDQCCTSPQRMSSDSFDCQAFVAQERLDSDYVDGYAISDALASVRMGSGGGTSGTIFFVGPYKGTTVGYGLSVAHGGYQVGSRFRVGFVDGSDAEAVCIDCYPREDLIMFTVHADKILGVAPLATTFSNGNAEAIGFPRTIGPIKKSLSYNSVHPMTDEVSGITMDRACWNAVQGGIDGGDSGCGIFVDDRIVGVVSHGGNGRGCHSASYDQLVKYAARVCGRFVSAESIESHEQMAFRRGRGRNRGGRGGGDPNCPDGQCEPDGSRAPAGPRTPAGPRDPWWLQPNFEIAVPDKPNRNPAQIENERRPDINGPREQKQAIAELQLQVKKLVEANRSLAARVDALEHVSAIEKPPRPEPDPSEPAAPPAPPEPIAKGPKGDKGEKGDKGDRGEPGAAPSEAKIAEIVDAQLAKKSFSVVFEAGDDPGEGERVVDVQLVDGELRIPPTQLMFRSLDEYGAEFGPTYSDSAPLGSPLRLRYEREILARAKE